MLCRQGGARLARLLRSGLDQALGVRGIGQLLTASLVRAASTCFELLLDRADVQTQALEEGRGRATISQQTEDDVLGPDGVMLQSRGLSPGIFQRTLGVCAKRVRIDASWRR